jgi:hypothetical protein
MITGVTNFDIPGDLVDLQRAWYAADARCDELAAALPSALDVVAGTAAPTPEQEAELAEARAERLRLTEELQGHGWWAAVDDKLAAKAALRKAARA